MTDVPAAGWAGADLCSLPSHLAARPSTFTLQVVFHTGECGVQTPPGVSVREMLFWGQCLKEASFWEKQKIVCSL